MTHAMLLPHLTPTAIRLTVLGQRAGITKQAAGQTVRDLERLGYVLRIPDPGDGRASLVSLTAQGHDFLNDALAIRAQIADEFAATLGAAPLAQLRGILTSLIEARPLAE